VGEPVLLRFTFFLGRLEGLDVKVTATLGDPVLLEFTFFLTRLDGVEVILATPPTLGDPVGEPVLFKFSFFLTRLDGLDVKVTATPPTLGDPVGEPVLKFVFTFLIGFVTNRVLFLLINVGFVLALFILFVFFLVVFVGLLLFTFGQSPFTPNTFFNISLPLLTGLTIAFLVTLLTFFAKLSK
jgi:hypothetical protein